MDLSRTPQVEIASMTNEGYWQVEKRHTMSLRPSISLIDKLVY